MLSLHSHTSCQGRCCSFRPHNSTRRRLPTRLSAESRPLLLLRRLKEGSRTGYSAAMRLALVASRRHRDVFILRRRASSIGGDLNSSKASSPRGMQCEINVMLYWYFLVFHSCYEAQTSGCGCERRSGLQTLHQWDGQALSANGCNSECAIAAEIWIPQGSWVQIVPSWRWHPALSDVGAHPSVIGTQAPHYLRSPTADNAPCILADPGLVPGIARNGAIALALIRRQTSRKRMPEAPSP